MDEPVSEISGYFAANGAEVRLLSFFHSLAALSLLAFAAYVSGLEVSDESRRLSTLALSGGVMAAVFLVLSALLFWTLARPATANEPPLARSLADLSYLAGGVALLSRCLPSLVARRCSPEKRVCFRPGSCARAS